jgi:hypothetical protein
MAEYPKPTKADKARGVQPTIPKTSQPRPERRGKQHPGLPKLPKSK